MNSRIFEPPEGAPKGAGDMDIKQVRNHFKQKKSKKQDAQYESNWLYQPAAVRRQAHFSMKLLLTLTGNPHKYIYIYTHFN